MFSSSSDNSPPTMGNDGGSIPDRRDLVRTKQKAEQADKANQTRARWFFCALSKKPLREPIVSCDLGRLYNKDALLEYLLDQSAYGDGDEICGHIRSLKDVKSLKLTPNAAPPLARHDASSDYALFVCPLTQKEMLGSIPFIFITTCGCVLSQAGFKAMRVGTADRSVSPKEGESELNGPESQQLDICPRCATKYDKRRDVRLLNPGPDDESRMREEMVVRRATEPAKAKSKKRKAEVQTVDSTDHVSSSKKKATTPLTPTLNPSLVVTSRSVVNSLATEEAKRKANMSDAVKSLYVDKTAPKKKETFTTMGTFTRYA